MTEYIMQHLWTIWAVVSALCLIMELTSGDFFITCFGIGALCALATSFFSVPLWAQVVVFAVFSVLSIYFSRPRLVELLNSNAHHRVSNADALLGRVGKVTQTIKTGDYGRVQIDGDDWKAESDAAFDIAEGSRVRIVGRESIIVKVEQI